MKSKLLLFLMMLNMTLFSQDINRILDSAGIFLVKQDYYQAIEEYKQALSINEFDIRGNRGLSEAYYLIGEYDESLFYIDRCINLDRDNILFKNSKARVYTALEMYDDAEKLYLEVLEDEMYNVAAKSGLAELRLVSGDLKGSLYDFEQILEFSPESRRLLLSLVVLYDSQKRFMEADEIIQRAIRIYPGDPVVLESAVRHYMNTKSYKGAALYIGELLNLTDRSDVLMLNAELLFYLGSYNEALDSLNQYMKQEKDNAYAYYLAALLLELKGDKELALSLIDRGLNLKPDEEIYRFYRELLAMDLYLLKDSKRNTYADWYTEQGQILEGRYYYEKARNYYLRGLDLAPFSQSLRESYAGILKKRGYKQLYLKELGVILKEHPEREDLQEIVDIEESLTPPDLYETWGGERFSYDEKLSLSVYINRESRERHLSSNNIVRSITERFLGGKRKYRLSETSIYSGKYSDAFARAREKGSDYYLILNYYEGSRTFSLKGTLYLTRSGRALKEFNYLKTGNSRIFNCYESFAEDLDGYLPLIGTVLDIKNRNILINLGMADSVEVDTQMQVIKKSSYKLLPEPPLVSFPKERELGVVVVKSVGEMMSAGEFTANSSFNLLNIGDEVVMIEESEDTSEDTSNSSIVDKELIDQLLRVN